MDLIASMALNRLKKVSIGVELCRINIYTIFYTTGVCLCVFVCAHVHVCVRTQCVCVMHMWCVCVLFYYYM